MMTTFIASSSLTTLTVVPLIAAGLPGAVVSVDADAGLVEVLQMVAAATPTEAAVVATDRIQQQLPERALIFTSARTPQGRDTERSMAANTSCSWHPASARFERV